MSLSFETLKKWILFIYFLSFVIFFAPVLLPLPFLKAVSWGVFSTVFISSLPEVFNTFQKNNSYYWILFVWILIFYFSVIVTLIHHNQNPILTLRLILDFTPLFLFFFLVRYEIALTDIENVSITVAFLYIFLFCVALYFAPVVIFDNTGGEIFISSQRGIPRVSLLGSNFIYFSFFIFIGKYRREKGILNLFMSVVMLIFIILTVSRQHIVLALFFGFALLLRKQAWYIKPIIILLIGGGLLYFANQTSIFSKLIELTIYQLESDGWENIRILAAEHFVFDYPSSFSTILFGQGIPYSTSDWGKSYWQLMNSSGYILSDIGYVKIYFYWGVIGLLASFWLFYKILTSNVSDYYLYAKYYMAFLIMANIASHNFFKDILFISLVLYICYKSQMSGHPREYNVI